MTGKEVNCLKGQKKPKRFQPHGEKQTAVVKEHIMQFSEPLKKGVSYVVPVYDVESKNPLLITRITKNLWK